MMLCLPMDFVLVLGHSHPSRTSMTGFPSCPSNHLHITFLAERSWRFPILTGNYSQTIPASSSRMPIYIRAILSSQRLIHIECSLLSIGANRAGFRTTGSSARPSTRSCLSPSGAPSISQVSYKNPMRDALKALSHMLTHMGTKHSRMGALHRE